jgi:hypothetical protein
LVLTGATAAAARPTESAVGAITAVPTRHTKCAKTTEKVSDLHLRISKLDDRLKLLRLKLTTAQDNGRTDQVPALQARISASEQREGHLQSLIAQITSACPA